MSFVIPKSATEEMVEAFTKLETCKLDLGVVDLQLSLPTLEEVFLAVASEASNEEEQKDDETNVDTKDTVIQVTPSRLVNEEGKKSSLWDQVLVLTVKNLILQSRDRLTLIVQLLLPVILLAALVVIQSIIGSKSLLVPEVKHVRE